MNDAGGFFLFAFGLCAVVVFIVVKFFDWRWKEARA